MSQQTVATARDARNRDRPARLLGWRHAAFFVGVPIIFALYMASSHRMLEVVPAGWVIAYSVVYSLLIWWMTCALCRGFFELLRRWRPHQLIILTLGMVLAAVLSMPMTAFLNGAFIEIWSDPDIRGRLASAMQTAHSDISFGTNLLRDGAIWIMVNLFFDRFLGLPRYRYALPAGGLIPPSLPETGSAAGQSLNEVAGNLEPGFLKRVDKPVDLGQVLAIKAEQHYIKVYTEDRQHMVLYRFSDAMNELPEDLGLQVHRSWWIRTSALTRLRQGGRKMFAELVTGDTIPISGPNQALVRKMAADADLPIRPLARDEQS